MKKNILRLVVTAIGFIALAVSCSKSNEADTQNTGTGGCDTVDMKYTANVLPIISGNCYSCHGNGVINGGIELDSYNKLLIQVNNGNLIGVITHSAGYPAMPQGKAKLSDCDINKIRGWIARGAQNN
jgi:cytochrome c553